jgi:hypothetical protein
MKSGTIDLAESFLGIMNCLDLSTIQEFKRPHMQAKINIKVKEFHDLFTAMDQEDSVQSMDQEDSVQRKDAKMYMDRLWELLKSFMPQCVFWEDHRSTCTFCNTENSTASSPPKRKRGWSLDLPTGNQGETLCMQNLLDGYMTSGGEALVKCQRKQCKQEYQAKLKLHAWFQVPAFMSIHLKRYSNDREKICTKVTLPSQTVTIHDFRNKKDLTFRVESIVAHTGDSASSGHYTAYSRRGVFDDSKVDNDGGVAFRTLLQDGEFKGALGYIYCFVQVDRLV